MSDKKKLFITHFSAMVISLFVIMGAHYVYDIWPNLTTSLLFPVNESIWEHCKLFVLPLILVYSVVYLIIGRKFNKYIPATALSLLHMPFSAIMIYHIYLLISPIHHRASGIIASALILLVSFTVSYRRIFKKKEISKRKRITIYVLVIVFLIIMAVFTYYPPKASWLEWLFMDRENMCYGLIPS